MGRYKLFALGVFVAGFFLPGMLASRAESLSVPVISEVSSKVGRATADFTWVATDEDAVAGVNFTYGSTLQYGLTSSVKFTYIFTSSGLKYNFSTSLADLAAGTQYYYRISVADTHNMEASYTGSFITLAEDSLAPIISRVAVAAQSESATISWDTDRDSSSIVSYRRRGEAGTIKTMENLVTKHYVYLGNLVPDTEYYYIISGVDAAGNKSVTDEKIFKTLPKVALPSDVGSYEIMAMDDSINLSWKNPVDPNFSRVVIVRKVGDQPLSPSDGLTVYSGKAQSFTDRSVLRGNDYYYTIYSVNNSGAYSAGTTRVIMFGRAAGTVVKPVATISSALRIRAEDLEFLSTDHHTAIAMVQGVVAGTPGTNISIHLPPSLLPYAPAKMILNVSGQIHDAYFVQNEYHFDFVFHPGRSNAYIRIDYTNGLTDVISFILEGVGESVSETPVPTHVFQSIPPPVMKVTQPPPALQSIVQGFQDTADVVSSITQNEDVKNTVSQFVAPTVVGVTAFSAISLVSFANIFPFFQLLFIEPLVLLGRRRRRGAGQVYNSLDKTPVALATVRLLSKDTGRVVQSRVTDENGRYSFVVNPGRYALQVSKRGFNFPSMVLLGYQDDGQKTNIYHGLTINVTASDASVSENIPIDPTGAVHKPARLIWQSIFSRLRPILYWGGFPILLFSLYISPRWYTWVLLVVHPAVLAFSYRLSASSKGKNWGTITDKKTNLPISQAIVRLYNAKYDKMVSSQITDSRGRYYLTAGDNEYYVTAEKAGYASGKTGLIDLKGKQIQSLVMDIALEKV